MAQERTKSLKTSQTEKNIITKSEQVTAGPVAGIPKKTSAHVVVAGIHLPTVGAAEEPAAPALNIAKAVDSYESGARVKTLPPSVVKDIEQKNVARRLAGLAPINVRVRRCLTCGSLFESSGNRTCGCSSRVAGTIAGREII